MVASTLRSEVLGGLGGFGGLFALDVARYRNPVLVSGTDGVGTKALVAQALGRFDTLGIDLVAMCVDDLVCHGAEPLFLLDYISTGSVDPTQMADLVSGVAEGCRQVGATLLGGEMAEHPGVMKPGEFDLVGFAVGVVEREEILGPHRVVAGDVLIGLPSGGLRCNGYTLARHVLLERSGLTLDGPAWSSAAAGDGAGSTGRADRLGVASPSLGDELLRPSIIYTPAVRAAVAGGGGGGGVHAVAHITGGGFEGNVPRMLPDGLKATVDRGSWSVPPIFSEIRRLGNVSAGEMARVFNLGLGMVMAVDPDRVDDALGALSGAGVNAVVVGRIDPVEKETGQAATGHPIVAFAGQDWWPDADADADVAEPAG
jgi:phosphoribosylformylglycinamidine cyclo-ligase